MRAGVRGQRSATGCRVAAAPSRATTKMLSCLWTSAQAADPELVFMALEQALARPGNVATEPVRGAQSTWLKEGPGETQSHSGTKKGGSLSLEGARLYTASHKSASPLPLKGGALAARSGERWASWFQGGLD